MSIILAAALLAAPAAETPRAFVDRLYAGYRDETYYPISRPEATFAPPLVAAIREDQRLSREEVGYLDADPLCLCQDPTGLRWRIAGIRDLSRTRAVADVQLDFPGSDSRELRLRLVRTAAGWRVDDVSSGDEKSLLAALRRANRDRRDQPVGD